MMVEILAGIFVVGIAGFVGFGLLIMLLKSFDTAGPRRKEGLARVLELEQERLEREREREREAHEGALRERAAVIEARLNREKLLQNGIGPDRW